MKSLVRKACLFSISCFIIIAFCETGFAFEATIIKKDGSKVNIENGWFEDTGCGSANPNNLRLLDNEYSGKASHVDIKLSNITKILLLERLKHSLEKYKVDVIMKSGTSRSGYWMTTCSKGGGVSYPMYVLGETEFGKESIRLKHVKSINFMH